MATREVATLLGVEKDLMLRALEKIGYASIAKYYQQDGRLYLHEPDAEHALREWLVAHCCLVRGTSGKTVVKQWRQTTDRYSIHLAYDPHYLTALCKAVCKLEDEDDAEMP